MLTPFRRATSAAASFGAYHPWASATAVAVRRSSLPDLIPSHHSARTTMSCAPIDSTGWKPLETRWPERQAVKASHCCNVAASGWCVESFSNLEIATIRTGRAAELVIMQYDGLTLERDWLSAGPTPWTESLNLGATETEMFNAALSVIAPAGSARAGAINAILPQEAAKASRKALATPSPTTGFLQPPRLSKCSTLFINGV